MEPGTLTWDFDLDWGALVLERDLDLVLCLDLDSGCNLGRALGQGTSNLEMSNLGVGFRT